VNIFDELPDIPQCPHCGHDGEGLEWAFPDVLEGRELTTVQCACLACGAHGPPRRSYAAAIEAFEAGVVDEEAA
jgi:hypothetical protein